MSRRMDRRPVQNERDEYTPPRGSGAKQLIILLAVAFIVTLGVVVGTRMSSDAIAVLVGVIAGVAASIPCALLLLAVTRRQQDRYRPYSDALESDPDHQSSRYGDRYERRPAPPPVIVVTPGSAAPQQIASWSTMPGPADGAFFSPYAYGSAQPQNRREFRVMGYEESEDQADWEVQQR